MKKENEKYTSVIYRPNPTIQQQSNNQYHQQSSSSQQQTSSHSANPPVSNPQNGITQSGVNTSRNQSISNKCCLCWCCCCSCSCSGLKNGNSGLNGGGNESKGAKPNSKDSNNDSDINCDSELMPSLEEIRSWGESFDKLMKSVNGRKVFREFLKCEYSEENILFWLACEELRKESKPELIEEKARLIYEDYISILSPKEVSLDSRVRELVNQNMVDPTSNTFDEAQIQIYTLMHRDSYPRFVNSIMYKKLAQLNAQSTQQQQHRPSQVSTTLQTSSSLQQEQRISSSSPASRKESLAI